MRLDEVPAGFVTLARAGRFDYWGAPYDSLTAEERDELMPARMLQVLWWDEEIEWDRTLDAVVAYRDDGRLRAGLVPFAGNGYGDQYCWYPPWQDGPEPPIVLFVHDELESRMFARDVGELLCRCMLRHFAVHDPDDGEPSARAQWDAHLAIIRPLLSAEQARLMDGIGADPDACTDADDVLAAQVGDRRLIGAMQPTQFLDDVVIQFSGLDGLLRMYDRSIEFYEELVHTEGRGELAGQLDAVRRAREAAASRSA